MYLLGVHVISFDKMWKISLEMHKNTGIWTIHLVDRKSLYPANSSQQGVRETFYTNKVVTRTLVMQIISLGTVITFNKEIIFCGD